MGNAHKPGRKAGMQRQQIKNTVCYHRIPKGGIIDSFQTTICEVSVHSRLRSAVHTRPSRKWRCGVRDGEQSPITIGQEYLPAQSDPHRSVASANCRSSYSLVRTHKKLAVRFRNVPYYASVEFLLSICDQVTFPGVSLPSLSINTFTLSIRTKAPVSKRQALAITLLIWLLSTLINVPYLLSYELVDGSYYVPKDSTPYCGKFCDETNWQSENSRRLYGTMVMLLQFVIPMSIITYCYFRILRKVSQDMIIQNVQFSASLSQKQRVDAISRKKKVNYILIGMVATFICCWLPLTAVNLVKDYSMFIFRVNYSFF
ncbi:7 transmembrane receptor [Ostertagia ostertagi]